MQLLARVLMLAICCSISSCSGGSSDSGSGSTTPVSLLSDLNGDGAVEILAFGDSITVGTRDNPAVNGLRGYPLRLHEVLHVPIDQSGVGGEDMANTGLNRLTRLLRNSRADIVLLDEGNSDALDGITPGEYRIALRSAVSEIKKSGKLPVLINQYPVCCDFQQFNSALTAMNGVMNDVAVAEGVEIVDLDRAWRSNCSSISNCDLLSAADGLHPSPKGYDAITQLLLATFAGIDLFSASGAGELEAAYGLVAGSVVVTPDS